MESEKVDPLVSRGSNMDVGALREKKPQLPPSDWSSSPSYTAQAGGSTKSFVSDTDNASSGSVETPSQEMEEHAIAEPSSAPIKDMGSTAGSETSKFKSCTRYQGFSA